MTTAHGTHSDLHSEQGALSGEHPGRAKNPVIKVLDLAWLEFEKPDLDGTEKFARAFGLIPVSQTPDDFSCEAPMRARRASSYVVATGPGTSAPRSAPPTPRTSCAWPTPPEPRSRSCPRASVASWST